jgi:hypothetical protein
LVEVVVPDTVALVPATAPVAVTFAAVTFPEAFRLPTPTAPVKFEPEFDVLNVLAVTVPAIVAFPDPSSIVLAVVVSFPTVRDASLADFGILEAEGVTLTFVTLTLPVKSACVAVRVLALYTAALKTEVLSVMVKEHRQNDKKADTAAAHPLEK